MKKFTVDFYYDINGSMEIEAESEQDAETKVKAILEEEGIDDEAKVDIIGREYNTTGVDMRKKLNLKD